MVATLSLVAPFQILGLIRILLDPSVTSLEHLHISLLTRRQTKGCPRVGGICTGTLSTPASPDPAAWLPTYSSGASATLRTKPYRYTRRRRYNICQSRRSVQFFILPLLFRSPSRSSLFAFIAAVQRSIPFTYPVTPSIAFLQFPENSHYQYAGIFEANSTCCPIWVLQFFFGGLYTSR